MEHHKQVGIVPVQEWWVVIGREMAALLHARQWAHAQVGLHPYRFNSLGITVTLHCMSGSCRGVLGLKSLAKLSFVLECWAEQS